MLNLELWIFCILISSMMGIFSKNATFRLTTLIMVIFCISVLCIYYNVAIAITFLGACFYLLIKNYNKLIDN